MNRISSGLLLLLGAAGLGVFWANGYLATWTADIAARVGGDTTKTPLTLPRADTGPQPGVAPVLPVIAPARPLPLFGGVA